MSRSPGVSLRIARVTRQPREVQRARCSDGVPNCLKCSKPMPSGRRFYHEGCVKPCKTVSIAAAAQPEVTAQPSVLAELLRSGPHVYIARVGVTPVVKIGWSRDVPERLRTQSYEWGREFTLLITLPGSRQMEKLTHEALKDWLFSRDALRSHGIAFHGAPKEWFLYYGVMSHLELLAPSHRTSSGTRQKIYLE